LQKITAQHINLSPILVCATGRAGGVRSKMMEAGYILCELDLCEGRFDRVLALVPVDWFRNGKRRCEIALRNRSMELRNPGMIALTAELLTRNFKTNVVEGE
jgi:hypothetical protein